MRFIKVPASLLLDPKQASTSDIHPSDLSDLLGRTGSYAQLYYVGDTTDSRRGKFYGDVSAKLTEISTLLLFFERESRRHATLELA